MPKEGWLSPPPAGENVESKNGADTSSKEPALAIGVMASAAQSPEIDAVSPSYTKVVVPQQQVEPRSDAEKKFLGKNYRGSFA